jgi:Protein of unknown function (DUF3109).
MDFLSTMDTTVRRWLYSPNSDPGEPDCEIDEYFNRWMVALMKANALLDVGGVIVDRSVLTAHFSCVSGRCAPQPERGRLRSCCADLDLPLTPGERFRLKRYGRVLKETVGRFEPRLAGLVADHQRTPNTFWSDADGYLRRPKQRCVFSAIDVQGRIRCHLYAVSRMLGVAITDLQPISCRLFPLVLVNLRRGRVLLTVLNRRNHKLWQAPTPNRFPCLSDPTLPPLVQSMSSTLDWLFGKSFARTLKRARLQL